MPLSIPYRPPPHGYVVRDLCPMQVTKDGVPMLWHDDSVLQKTAQEEGRGASEGGADETSREVADMTAEEMQKVVWPPNGGVAPGGDHLHLMRHFRGSKSRAPIPGPTLPWWVDEIRDTILSWVACVLCLLWLLWAHMA